MTARMPGTRYPRKARARCTGPLHASGSVSHRLSTLKSTLTENRCLRQPAAIALTRSGESVLHRSVNLAVMSLPNSKRNGSPAEQHPIQAVDRREVSRAKTCCPRVGALACARAVVTMSTSSGDCSLGRKGDSVDKMGDRGREGGAVSLIEESFRSTPVEETARNFDQDFCQLQKQTQETSPGRKLAWFAYVELIAYLCCFRFVVTRPWRVYSTTQRRGVFSLQQPLVQLHQIGGYDGGRAKLDNEVKDTFYNSPDGRTLGLALWVLKEERT
ncbi:hypothetical protein DFH06DRAFT_1140583 [Mycena polygramma]|nr:hypothetical protein DFH06DRAFT_1140583 [Mycena polygramma]